MSVPYTPQHRFDLVPSPVDHRDFRLSAPIDAASLPPSATLPLDPTIRDQGQEGSCWGFSGSSAHGDGRFMAKKSTELETLSPAFLYWQTRRSMGDTADDTGSDLRTGLDTLLHVGNCLESAMPYHAGDWAVEPPADAVIDASTRTIVAYHRLTTLAEIKYTIAVLKLPVVLGIPVTQAFEEARNGVVPMILPSDKILGGHAIRYGARPAELVGIGSWRPRPLLPAQRLHLQLVHRLGRSMGNRAVGGIECTTSALA
jgi:hypothetical protein